MYLNFLQRNPMYDKFLKDDSPYVEVTFNFYRDSNVGVTKKSLMVYDDMIYWLEYTCPNDYRFIWSDKTRFFPSAIKLLPETATVFRLRYDI